MSEIHSMTSKEEPSTSAFGSLNVNYKSSTPYSDATKCRKLSKHVKRPLNPFMVWSRIERMKIIELHPNLHNADVSKQLGQKWKDLSLLDRTPFIQEAERLRVLHSQEYPDYKYTPKKRKSPLKNNKFLYDLQEEKTKLSKELLHTLDDKLKKNSKEKSSKKLVAKNCPVSNKLPTGKRVDPLPSTSKQHDMKKLKFKKRKHAKLDPAVIRLWDMLTDVDVTTLPIDQSPCDGFYRDSDFEKFVTRKTKFKSPLPLHVDGCLTSGSIAALACYREDYAETFDFLRDKVLQNSKNICQEIENISKHYKALLNEDPRSLNISAPELDIPDINKILGKNWEDPDFGVKFTSC